MALIKFAPDGKHWQIIKKGKINKLWDYFISSEILLQTLLNPSARFQLISDNDKVIGELPRRKENVLER